MTDLSADTIAFLKQSGEKAATYGHIIMAAQIHEAISTLHQVCNQLPKGEDNYESRVMFLNGAIKILEKELQRNLDSAITHWILVRRQYGAKETTVAADSKGSQENERDSDSPTRTEEG